MQTIDERKLVVSCAEKRKSNRKKKFERQIVKITNLIKFTKLAL